MKNPYIIGIGGTSGVGKTTIANIISILFKNETFLILSGDDLHKWERNDLNWQIYTHFNPKANNIKKGYDDLKNLKNFSSIYRKKYNHETGKFDEIKLITSKENIIYEGLHSLYDKDTLDLIDLKIFIDTDKDLTEKWKIKRDIKKRGYTEKEVKDIINRRKIDKKKFIEPQKNNADIIFKFYEDNSNKINLDCVFCKPNFIEISEKIKNIYNINNTFFTLSKILSTDVSLIQGSSGNISIKYDDKLMIKSSGYKISQINLFDGYIICQKFNKQNNFIDENEYNEDVKKNIYHGNGYPSMEIGFHNFLKNKIIIHTHPIYLNCILCSKESYEIINKLFNFLNYEYINYITPGYELANYFIENKNNKDIIFLENHGLIIGCDTIEDGIKKTKMINNICKNWIENNIELFIDLNNDFVQKNKPLFPDAVVFQDELNNINTYIFNIINECCLTPKFLNNEEINKINKLESEKKRKKLYENNNTNGRFG